MLKSVNIKKYSANCSRLNSASRAIHFAARISPAFRLATSGCVAAKIG